MDAARQIVRQEGAAALWSGVTPTIARNGKTRQEEEESNTDRHTHAHTHSKNKTGTQQATMFYFKGLLDEHLWGKDKQDPDKKLEVHQSMISGLLASCPGMYVFKSVRGLCV